MTNGKEIFTNEIDFSDYDKQKDLTVMENRYDKYKDSGIDWIGKIPEHWEIVKIKNIFNISSGATPKTDNMAYWDGEIIWITPADYKTEDKIIKSGKRNITLAGLNSCGTSIIPKDSIIFSKRAPIGLVAINVVPLCTNQGCISCIPKSFVYSKYFYFLMSVLTEWFELFGSGTTFKELSTNNFANFNLSYPPLAEQQAIADYLDRRCSEIDDLIALQEEMITKLQSYKQSVITEAVTRGLDKNVPLKDSGIDWIGKIPEHWSRNKIVRLFSIIGSGTTPKSNKGDNYIGSINWIQSGDINGGYIENCKNTISKTVLKEYSALKIYKAPFIIVAMYGASVGNISISKIDGCVNQACCVMNDTEQNFRYLFYSIISVKNYLIYKAEGGGQPNISQDKIKNTWLPIPPLAEQQAIADYLDQRCSEIDELIALKQQKIEKLKEYKKSLIFECVTGKRKVS